MNNSQLLYELEQINLTVNELDRFEKLMAFGAQYKKSDFYQKTKLPLPEVLKYLTQAKMDKVLSKILNLFNGELMAAKIEEFIDNLDEEKIMQFFDGIAAAIDPAQLQESQGELTALLNKLPR